MASNKIVVVGPGIVGMPMAALLASGHPGDGSPPPRVVVVQRNSASSGWKVDAINSGRSPLGPVEPELARVVAEAVASGRLSAAHDYSTCSDASVILVCVTTDRSGFAPDYESLTSALESIATALRSRPVATRPLVIIESTLAPSTMQSVVSPLFAKHGLIDGRDVLLGNSPSRVLPVDVIGRLHAFDKVVGGLHPETPVHVATQYRRIMPRCRLLVTNSLTAELVKTLENAWRDVRLAFLAEVVRYCDRADIDFFTLRALPAQASAH